MAYIPAREAITLRNQRESPLLRLPAEIRNQIYSHVLGGVEFQFGLWVPSPFRSFASKMRDHAGNVSWTRSGYVLAPTATSRQIHSETMLLPFELNSFGLYDYYPWCDLVETLLPKQRNAIRTIRLLIDGYCYTGQVDNNRVTLLPYFRESDLMFKDLKEVILELNDQTLMTHSTDFVVERAKKDVGPKVLGWRR